MNSHASHDSIRAVQWHGDRLRLLDQRRLPTEETWFDCTTSGDVTQAIRDLAVRGAPAIGIAAAWGVVLAAKAGVDLPTAMSTLRARASHRGEPDVGAGSHEPAHPRRRRCRRAGT